MLPVETVRVEPTVSAQVKRRKMNKSINKINVFYGYPSERKGKKHSKYLGVHWNGLKFTAKITIKGVRHYLGVFDTEELAYSAYLTKKRESHEGNIL